MSEDRELVERMASIEATPRAGWIAELRADLDAAWDTGELPLRQAAPLEPARRWPARTWLVASISVAAVAVLLVALVVVPRNRSDVGIPSITAPPIATAPTPVTTSPSVSVAPSPTTTPSVIVASAPITTTPSCEPIDVAGYRFAAVSATSVWTLEPDACITPGSPTDGFTIEETDVASGAVVTKLHMALADLERAGATVRRAFRESAPAPLTLTGMVGRTMVLRTNDDIIGIDVDTSSIARVAMPSTKRQPEYIFATNLRLVGDAVIVVADNQLFRADFDTGAAVPFGEPDIAAGSVAGYPDTSEVRTGPATADPDALWLSDGTSVTRIDPDGSAHRLDQLSGTVVWLIPGPGTLWAITVAPGVDPSTAMDPQTPGAFVRLDRETGSVVAGPLVPPETVKHPMTFKPYPGPDGVLAVFDDSWWWADNDGQFTILRPQPFNVLGVVGNRIVGITNTGDITSVAIDDISNS